MMQRMWGTWERSTDWSRRALVLLAVAGGGCSACSQDQAAPVAVTPTAETVAAAAAAPQAACRAGLIAPVGYAPITELPSLGGNEVFVQDVNDDGVVVGSQRAADGLFHAFRYTDEGGLADLGPTAGPGSQGFASAIASDGSIGGHADRGDGTGTLFGYRYTASAGRVQVCSTPCSIWDLNAHEQVVGVLVDPADALKWQAFLYSPGAGLRRLGTLGGARSSAAGINEAGVVVGSAQLADSAKGDVGHAFVYDGLTGLRDLNTLAGASGAGWVLKVATDVSATQVVGYGAFQGHTRPFVFDLATSTVRALGAEARDAFSSSIDSHGDVVGWSARDASTEAFVFSATLGLRRLGDFVDPAEGWDLVQANGLNDRGELVGWGYRAGAARGFKLKLPLCARPSS
jgi:probable HAF family extracellular repeat protein